MYRLTNALKADIKFQYKQGFYMIYMILTLFYMVLFSQLPGSFLPYVVPYIIYSDPSVLGLFFIGSIILLEKEQGILSALVVTPLKTQEYMYSKLISLTLLSVIASVLIGIGTFGIEINFFYLIIGTILTSVFYTLVGFIIATGCKTVNGFIFKMVPWMLLLILPCLSLIPLSYNWANKISWIFRIVPSVATVRLIAGGFNGIPLLEGLLLIVYMVGFNILLFKLVVKIYEKRIVYGGAAS